MARVLCGAGVGTDLPSNRVRWAALFAVLLALFGGSGCRPAKDDRTILVGAHLSLSGSDRDGVLALVGEVASSRSIAGGLVANAEWVPMITPSSTNVAVTAGRPYVFRACFTDDMQGRLGARFAASDLGKKRIAILYAAQESYSAGLASSFREEIHRGPSSPTRATRAERRISPPISRSSARSPRI